MKKVSVIVPVYNVSKYLPKCLDSLLGQNFTDFEIILVNDGSTDNSQDIIDTYSKKYPDIIKSYVQKNGGQGSARNNGLLKSCGEYVCFVDSDDYVDTFYLCDVYNYAKANDYDVVVFDYYKLYDNNREICNGLIEYSDDIRVNYMLSPAGPCNKLYKRELLVDNKLFFMERTIYEDLGLIPTIVNYTNKIGYLNKSYYFYLIRSGSTMNQITYSDKLQDIFKIMDHLYTELKDDYYIELEYLYIINLLHGAGLRFLCFDEGKKDIYKISQIIYEKFPKWINNKYLKKENFKYKIVCYLLYKRKIKLLKMILKK